MEKMEKKPWDMTQESWVVFSWDHPIGGDLISTASDRPEVC